MQAKLFDKHCFAMWPNGQTLLASSRNVFELFLKHHATYSILLVYASQTMFFMTWLNVQKMHDKQRPWPNNQTFKITMFASSNIVCQTFKICLLSKYLTVWPCPKTKLVKCVRLHCIRL